MSILGRLGEKSWEAPGVEVYQDPSEYRPAAVAVGLYVYMGVVIVLFSLITAAYLMRMGISSGMDHGTNDWRRLPEPQLLWINTLLLIVSSAAWELARRHSMTGLQARTRLMASVGGLFAVLFLAGQLALWHQYYSEGYYLASNPANSFFYLLTTVHGLHLIGGLVAGAIALRPMNVGADAARIALNIRLCALYWHFLLLAWLLLAGLLVMT